MRRVKGNIEINIGDRAVLSKAALLHRCQIIMFAFITIIFSVFAAPEAAAAAQFTVTVCTDCHAYPPADGTARNNPAGAVMGSHSPHVSFAIACTTCHADTTSGETDFAHRDGNIDLANPIHSGTGAYSKGTSFAQANDINGTGLGSCSNIYCHSTGQSTSNGSDSTPTYSTPDWGDSATGACGTCHKVSEGTGLTSGSHGEHLGTAGVNGCSDCHTGAADNASSYNSANHVNQLINVANTYSAAGAPGNGYGTCSAASCHSNGLGTYKTSPAWGTSGTTCNTCHNSLPTTGSHSKHVLTAAASYGSTAVSSTSGNYDFGCGNCHPAVESGNHKNGTLDITLNSTHGGTLKSKNNVSDDTSGYVQSAGTSVTCSAAYCHSDENGTFATTPEWYGGTFAGDVCANCHGNSPGSGSHSGHAVGIHYDTIFSGTSGLMTASGGVGAGAAHGDPNTSTTISCNICHNNTVTVARNDNNTVCNTCHNAEGNALVGTDLDKTKHVNGTPDIAFANVTLRSKAQIRNDITTVTELNTYWQRNSGYKAGATSNDSSIATLSVTAGYSGGTCSTVACHNGNSVTWGNAISCDACHTALP